MLRLRFLFIFIILIFVLCDEEIEVSLRFHRLYYTFIIFEIVQFAEQFVICRSACSERALLFRVHRGASLSHSFGFLRRSAPARHLSGTLQQVLKVVIIINIIIVMYALFKENIVLFRNGILTLLIMLIVIVYEMLIANWSICDSQTLL